MSNKTSQARTKAQPFAPIQSQNMHLCTVNAGIDASTAAGHASCLESFVITRLGYGAGAGDDAGGLDIEECYALEFLLQAAQALRQSAGEA